MDYEIPVVLRSSPSNHSEHPFLPSVLGSFRLAPFCNTENEASHHHLMSSPIIDSLSPVNVESFDALSPLIPLLCFPFPRTD